MAWSRAVTYLDRAISGGIPCLHNSTALDRLVFVATYPHGDDIVAKFRFLGMGQHVVRVVPIVAVSR